jgi:ribosomal peptide maturation radical SAM protein 1
MQSTLRLALAAMPWSRRDRPSAAVGALAAYVRRERPNVDVTSSSEFIELAYRIGMDLYDTICEAHYEVGEPIYAPLLYPERRENVRQAFIEWGATHIENHHDRTFDDMYAKLAEHLDETADALSRADVIGLTTSFGQLFSNLALAHAIKQRNPGAFVILGGSTVSARVGPSILAEYPFVDFVLQGEGELPLVALLDTIAEGNPAAAGNLRGVLSQANAAEHPGGATMWEVPNMDALPFPDFDEYAVRAETYGVDWHLPIEGSRGCWWDRTKKTGSSKSICYFCNLNLSWNGYREKSVERVVEELGVLSDKYKNLKTYFLDNIIRRTGVVELAEGIQSLGKDFEIFYEMRANVKPIELVAMYEAGLRRVQFGIEGLSTAWLKRIGKGTTLLQNLQAMRTCRELGIYNAANLISDFPGSTPDDVAETVDAIKTLALSFQPLRVVPFLLGTGSTVETLREEFGVINVRNRDNYGPALPETVKKRLHVLDLSFELAAPPASWQPVIDAVDHWEAVTRAKAPRLLLYYRDGGSFLVVDDDRFEDFRSGTFEGLEREVYLYCMEIRTRDEVAHRFAGRASAAGLDAILAQFVEFKIMATERERFLSLAIATSPHIAAKRIRAELAREQERERKAS